MTDWSQYTDEQLDQAILEIGVERGRRNQIEAIPLSMLTLNRDFLVYTGVVQEQQWRPPSGPHDSYPRDWQVLHDDKLWTSQVDFNDEEPGLSETWYEVAPDRKWEGWTEPEAAPQLADVERRPSWGYREGDKVEHDGKRWRSVVNNNTWTPGDPDASAFWTEVPSDEE